MQFLINFGTMKSIACLGCALILFSATSICAKLIEENETVVQVWCGEHIPKLITTKLDELSAKIEKLEQKLTPASANVHKDKTPDIEKMIADSVKEHYTQLTLETLTQTVKDMQKNQHEILAKLTAINHTMTNEQRSWQDRLEFLENERGRRKLRPRLYGQNTNDSMSTKNPVYGIDIDENEEVLTLLRQHERMLLAIKVDLETEFRENFDYQRDLQVQVMNRIDDQFNQFQCALTKQDFEAINRKVGETYFNNTPAGATITFENCAEALKTGEAGVYKLQLPQTDLAPFDAYCMADDSGGDGWTIIQRRQDGSVDFYAGWLDYKFGFGDVHGEYWLGLERIYQMTSQRPHELWIMLVDYVEEKRHAHYTHFEIGSESEGYYLKNLGEYTGDAGDSLGPAGKTRKFTTNDVDNDLDSKRNCAVAFTGAWWYNNCNWSDLNSQYNGTDVGKGINWNTFRGFSYSMAYAHMAIRPVLLTKN